MIIDAHLHVWSDNEERFPFAGKPPGNDGSVERLRREMPKAGVEKAVIVQPIYHGYDHRYVLAAMSRFPGQFAGVALVDPHAPDAPDQLEERVRGDGFGGMRLYLSQEDDPAALAAPAQDPLWERAQALGSCFIIFGQARDLPAIEPIIARFPGVQVVIDHLAQVSPDEAAPGGPLDHLLALQRYPNVYVKVSNMNRFSQAPYPHPDMVSVARRVYDAFGARRLMWGSDFPHVMRDCGYERALAMVQAQLDWLDDHEREWLFARTALEVWSFGRD